MRDTMLIMHFIGLAMGLGTGFGFIFLGIASSKMGKDEQLSFMLNTFALSRMGHIGLALLIISGVVLINPYWSALGTMPALAAKLILILILTVLIALMAVCERKAAQGDAETHIQKLRPLGTLSDLISLAIVILSVLVFH